MTRRGDWIKVMKKNENGLSVGETLLVKSGADCDGQILVWLPDGSTAVFDWDEYRTVPE